VCCAQDVITSTSNAHIKYARSLSADRRKRHRERSFVLEGVRLVGEALAAQAVLRVVLYAPEQLDQTPAGQQLMQQLAGRSECYATSERALAAAADTVTPQGVVAVAAMPEWQPMPGLTLVLDAVQDPGNVGTLLRSAEAAGASQVLCSRGSADVYSPKVVRAAMGAHFALAIGVDLAWQELADHLRGSAQIYAASGTAAAPYYAVDWRGTVALIVGNEAQGLSSAALAQAHQQIAIPMQGRAESLNAAVAGSVILFEALRQRSISEA
jgi:TrmH family RNA methyltransferase